MSAMIRSAHHCSCRPVGASETSISDWNRTNSAASSSGSRRSFDNRPWRTAFFDTMRFPCGVLGPVDFWALRRFCRYLSWTRHGLFLKEVSLTPRYTPPKRRQVVPTVVALEQIIVDTMTYKRVKNISRAVNAIRGAETRGNRSPCYYDADRISRPSCP